MAIGLREKPLVNVETDLRPVVDGVGDGVHGEGVTADEVAAEVDLPEAVDLGVQEGDLPDVVTDAQQQTARYVLLTERLVLNRTTIGSKHTEQQTVNTQNNSKLRAMSSSLNALS